MNVLLTDVKAPTAPRAMPMSQQNQATTKEPTDHTEKKNFRSMMRENLQPESNSKPQLVEKTNDNEIIVAPIVDSEILPDGVIVPAVWLESPVVRDIGVKTDTSLMPQLGDGIARSEYPPDLNSKAISTTIPVVGDNLPVNGKSLPLLIDQTRSLEPILSDRVKNVQSVFTVDGDIQSTTKGLSAKAAAIDINQSNGSSQLTHSDFFESLNAKSFEFNALQQTGVDTSSARLQAAMAAINGMQNQPSNTSTANPATSTPMLPNNLDRMVMTNPDSSTQWSSGLGERVSVMLNQKQHLATIRLDPPSLGKMDIQIQIKDDVTNVMINTQHAQTRDMVDSASYRLKEFLQDVGYQNVNVDVSHQSDQQKNNAQFMTSSESTDDFNSGTATDSDELTMTAQITSSESLVDFFA